jgi:hypothetical protein
MVSMRYSTWRAAVVLVLLGTAGLGADTLVLRDGSRVDGRLLAVRDETVEFQERGSRRRIVRHRDEVLRIDLSDDRGGAEASPPSAPIGRPRGLREREVVVAAGTAWVDSGIDVRRGQEVYFEADGQVRWGRDRRDGPAGERNSPYNATRPMPRRPAAGLIGKLGQDSADLFFIGDDRGPIRVPSAGRLFLGINDDVLADNSGSFRVVVYY